MKAFKKILSLLLALAMLLALAACGDSSGSSGAESGGSDGGSSGSSGSADVLEVKIWDNNQLAGLQEIADLWTEQSGVKVNIQVVTWDDYWTLLEAGASGGEMPDVFWMHSNNAQMYMEANKLLNLNDYIAASDVVKMENYLPGITELFSLDGNQYAIAKDHDTNALLYNKVLFDKYEQPYPDETWTWETFYEVGKAITDAGKADGVYGAAMNTTNDQDSYFNIIYDYGGYVINEDHTASGWDNENTKAAMNFVGKLCSDVLAPQELVSENGTSGLFKNDMAAMIIQGSYTIAEFYAEEDAENFAWAIIPYYDANGDGTAQAEERCSIYNGLGWAASASTKDPDACWSLIEWFSSPEMQAKQSELGVTMSGMVDDSYSAGFANAFPGMDIDPFLEVAEVGTLVFRPYSKYTSRWSDQYQTELVAAWQDPSQMDAVLDNLAAEMNDLLAQE